MARRGIGLGWAVPLLLVGLVTATVSLYFSFLDQPFRGGVITTGTVTSLNVVETTRKNWPVLDYTRNVTFRLRDGRTVTVSPDQTSERSAPPVGERVRVSYRPENPQRVRLLIPAAPLDRWLRRAFILIGALLALAGLNGIVQRFDRRPPTG